MDDSDDNYTHFPVDTSDGLKFIHLGNLVYCEADGCYTNFIMQNPDAKIVSCYAIGIWEQRLPRKKFCRISQSHITHKDQADTYLNAKDGTLILKSGISLTVSRTRKERFYAGVGYERPKKPRKAKPGAYCNACLPPFIVQKLPGYPVT